MGWNGSLFDGSVIEIQQFAISVHFSSRLDLNIWKLVCVYGPCLEPARSNFVYWLKNLDIQDTKSCIVLGDFNFYRSLEDRNRSDGNFQDTLIFNEIIDHLGLVELPLKGRAYTWSNMQNEPLLEQLDWFFTSVNWTTDFPNTMVIPWPDLHLILSPAEFQLVQVSPKLIFFDLKITGPPIALFWIL